MAAWAPGAGAGCCGGACACRYAGDLAGGFNDRVFPIQNDLFCVAQFLRTGGNFARLLVATRLLKNKVLFKQGAPPAEACLFAEEMKKLLVAAYGREKSPSNNALRQYDEKVSRFFKVLNGRPWLDHPEIHFDGDWLQIGNIEAILAEMETRVKEIILPHMPAVPSANKWTKTAPAVRFQATGNLFGLMNISWGKPRAASP